MARTLTSHLARRCAGTHTWCLAAHATVKTVVVSTYDKLRSETGMVFAFCTAVSAERFGTWRCGSQT